MSTTVRARPSRATPSSEIIDAKYLVTNPWNPNRMTKAMRAKARESIETYGFIDPLLVREIGHHDYQIIDGEHRFDEGKALGMTEFPCVNLGLIDDADAKKLTIVMNELHGQADPDKLGDLLTDILAGSSLEELMVALPYDEAVLAGYLGTMPELPSISTPAKADPADKTVWVERLYRMPKEAALVVDEAIEKCKDGDEVEQWQALERIAADYLAS